jgi:hypothetical protein
VQEACVAPQRGAALVLGAVIGDDAGTIVMLGGAGIGLYGLYLFLT